MQTPTSSLQRYEENRRSAATYNDLAPRAHLTDVLDAPKATEFILEVTLRNTSAEVDVTACFVDVAHNP